MLAIYLAMIEEDSDKELFAEIYERYELKIYKVAYNALGSHQRAEDAVHETMIRLIQHLEQAKNIYQKSCAEFEAWIVIIVKNIARDIQRKESHTVELDEDWDLAAPISVRAETEFRALVDLIRSMPEKYRRVLELRLVLEWDFDQIGRDVGIAANTARVRFQRGRIMLRERLEEMGYTYNGSGV